MEIALPLGVVVATGGLAVAEGQLCGIEGTWTWLGVSTAIKHPSASNRLVIIGEAVDVGGGVKTLQLPRLYDNHKFLGNYIIIFYRDDLVVTGSMIVLAVVVFALPGWTIYSRNINRLIHSQIDVFEIVCKLLALAEYCENV